MTALAAEAILYAERPKKDFTLRVGADVKIWKGAKCAIQASYLIPAIEAAALKHFCIATQTVDNTGGAAGDVNCNVEFAETKALVRFLNDTVAPVTADEIGESCYIIDDSGLVSADDDGGTRTRVGTPWLIIGASDPIGQRPGVYVELDSSPAIPASTVTFEDAGGLYAATNLEALALELAITAAVRRVRGVVVDAIADLSAFTVAGNDGLTYSVNQKLLYLGDATGLLNGVYVVGTVAVGVAPLTRSAAMPAGAAYGPGSIVEVSEGTIWRGSTWKVMATGAPIVGTDDPLYYPRKWSKIVTLSSGPYIAGAGGGGEPVYLYSTTTSDVQATRNTAGGTLTLTTHYFAPTTGRVAGKAGTAAVPVTASVAAGTINTADNSTINLIVTNW